MNSSMASPTETDLRHLRRCIALASEAREAGQHPFAAMVVDENGEVLIEAQNHVAAAGRRSHATCGTACREQSGKKLSA